MEIQDHVQSARDLMARADLEVAGAGCMKIAGQLQWGAFVQGLIGLAETLTMPANNEKDFRKVTQQLDYVASGTAWEDRYEAAEKLQENFLYGSLSDQETGEIMLLTKEATVELLTKL